MTEEEFKAVKVGDKLERHAPGHDDKHFRGVITKPVDSGRNFSMEITEVLGGNHSDIAVGKTWIGTSAYPERYTLLDQAPIAFPTSPAEPEKHIAGISPEVINFDAGRELVM